MFNYFAYGLGITSNIAIPEFTVRSIVADVNIVLDRNYVESNADIKDTMQLTIKVTPTFSYVFDRLVGTFYIYNGNKIVAVPAANASIEQVRIYLVGTVMALVLHQRSLLILHGSGVVIDGRGVALVGRSGSGKSSLAAALSQRGHRLISDDIFPIDLNTSVPQVYPGFGQYKLSEAAAKVLQHEKNSLLNRDIENRGYIDCPNFKTDPVPLERVYILAKDGSNAVAAIEPREVITQLLCYMVPTIWGMKQTPENFFHCSKLAQTTPFYTLTRGDRVAALPDLATLVENHVRSESHALVSV